jgi:hypothetical protein
MGTPITTSGRVNFGFFILRKSKYNYSAQKLPAVLAQPEFLYILRVAIVSSP